MDVGEVDKSYDEVYDYEPGNGDSGYYDEDGNWWTWTTDVNQVAKGKGKAQSHSATNAVGMGT